MQTLEENLDGRSLQNLNSSNSFGFQVLWRKDEDVAIEILIKRGECHVCRVARQLRRVICVNNMNHLQSSKLPDIILINKNQMSKKIYKS